MFFNTNNLNERVFCNKLVLNIPDEWTLVFASCYFAVDWLNRSCWFEGSPYATLFVKLLEVIYCQTGSFPEKGLPNLHFNVKNERKNVKVLKGLIDNVDVFAFLCWVKTTQKWNQTVLY